MARRKALPRPPTLPRVRLAIPLAVAALVIGAARGQDANPGGPYRVLPIPGGYNAASGRVAAAGDLDGDGRGDLAVGIPDWWDGGLVLVLSGEDGSVLRTVDAQGSYLGDGFGESIAALPDLDGRGKPEILVGAPRGQAGIPEASQPTFARAFAGEDGAVLFDSGPRSPDSHFGHVVAGLGDLDGDGVADLAASSMNRKGEDSFDGAVHVFSGSSGTPLGTLEAGNPAEYFGSSIAALGDVDGDGRPDFAVGAPGATVGKKTVCGRVSIVSGATLQEIRSIRGRRTRGRFGTSLAALGPSGPDSLRLFVGSAHPVEDIGSVVEVDAVTGRRIRTHHGAAFDLISLGDQDGDGAADFARFSGTVGDDGESDSAFLVEAVSGATGRLLLGLRGWPGEAIRPFAAGDVDGDGLGDLAVTVRSYDPPGEVRVYRLAGEPVPRSVRVALQRPESARFVDFPYFGVAEISPGGPRQPIALDLPFGPSLGDALLEDAPGSGTFLKVGQTRLKLGPADPRTGLPTYEGVVLNLEWTSDLAPIELRRSTLADLAGRLLRVTARDAADQVRFQAVIPASGIADFDGVALLAPETPGDGRDPRGRVRVRSSGRDGTVRVSIAARRLPRGESCEAWMEDAAGARTFTLVGTLERGRLAIDTALGDPLPGVVSDGAALSGRALEIRTSGAVVLRGSLP